MYQIHNMHGPTIHTFKGLPAAIEKLTELNSDTGAGPYRLINNDTGKTLTWFGWHDRPGIMFPQSATRTFRFSEC